LIASSIVAGADVVNESDALSVLFGFAVTVTALTVSGSAAVVDAAAPVDAVECCRRMSTLQPRWRGRRQGPPSVLASGAH
jgi:hypothetical protein